MKKIYVSKKYSNYNICNTILSFCSQLVSSKSSSSSSSSISIIVSFISGCVLTTTILVNQKWYYQTIGNDSSLYYLNQIHRDLWIQQSSFNTIASSSSLSSCPTNNTSSSSIIQQEKLIVEERYLQQQQQEDYDDTIETDTETETDIDKHIYTNMILKSLRILVVIVSYDFSQLPHLEEVISSYHDVCSSSGLKSLDIHIHTTVPYPISLIDLFNSRINCPVMTITISIKPKSLRLYLVNCHKKTFYNNINNYDLFIYTEDDIRVTATTISSYLYETKFVEQTISKLNANSHFSTSNITNTTTTTNNRINRKQQQRQYKASDFNIGIVRYEYNYPSNVIIDDKTRHATQNVTRVYWESSGKYDHITDVIPNAVQTLTNKFPSYTTTGSDIENNSSSTGSNIITTDIFNGRYITMKNHHQGMYLATRQLLIEWDKRCQFSIATKRPGTKHIPSHGTQRVWVSTNMLYKKFACNVQQLLPTTTFGTLTVYHLPNKNYRRVGKYHNRTFSTGTEIFDPPHSSLLSSMELHIAVRQYMYKLVAANKQQQSQSQSQQQQRWFSSSTINQNSGTNNDNNNVNIYTGAVRMIDEVDIEKDRTLFLERRMKEYENYILRGGILSETDMKDFDLSDTTSEL